MKTVSRFFTAAALAAAIIPAAFAAAPTAGSALVSSQPEHQHRYVQVGRDRAWVHLDRVAESKAANSGKVSAQLEHEHHYVQIGRDRTSVHLDHLNARAPLDARLVESTPVAHKEPFSKDLVGSFN